MEPWDGPASIAFTDGVRIGAILDRNGLRPSRYYVTKDDLVIWPPRSASSTSRRSASCTKGRLQPGRMFLVDTEEGRIIADEEIKHRTANEKPYAPVAARQPRHAGGGAGGARRPRRRPRDGAAAAAGLRLHARGPEQSCWRRWRARASSRSARWATTRRWPCSRTGRSCSTTTSSSSSPRSPTRRSTRSAKRSSWRWTRRSAPSSNLLEPTPHSRAPDQARDARS